MDEKQDPPKKGPTWTKDAKVGFGPVREALKETRDQVAASISDVQREIEQKRALLARFGRR